jgi:hypothetical protein
LNHEAFNTVVWARFPDLPFRGIQEDFETRQFHVMVSEPVSDATAAAVVAFTDGLGLPFSSDVRVEDPQMAPLPAPDGSLASNPARRLPVDPMRIRAPRARPTAPVFVRSDDAFWFENLGAAAAGRLPLERFPGVTPDAFRCFLDLSLGEHINLRQALLLYDEVYCSLPLADGHAAFLKAQGLTEADLLGAVAAGRLKFVSTQPEERLNLPFLEAVAERCPDAILGRRAAALLLISDIAETAERYRLDDPRYFPLLRDVAEAIGPQVGLTPVACLRALLWPLAARRRSLSGLMEEGTKRGPALLLGEALAEAVQTVGNVDVFIPALMLSERVHLGHALKATVFPAISDPAGYAPLMTALGQELNFYRSFNTAIAAAWAANEHRRAQGVQILPPIPFLTFERKVPLCEVLEDGALGSTRAQGRALMGRLAELPAEAREGEIDALADRFRRRWRWRDNRVLSLDHLDTGLSLASTVGHGVFPPVMGLVHAGAALRQNLQRLPVFDRFVQAFQEDFAAMRGGNQDLDFLSKIQRVAQLKRDRV